MDTTKKVIIKTLLLVLLILVVVARINAQGIGQVFSQGQTQNQYMMQQIAALQVYEGYLQKGYSTVKSGTGTISNIKNGDLNLHKGHMDSLKIVSSTVKNYSKVKGTTQLQQQIITAHNNTYPQLTGGNQLVATELTEYNTVYQSILEQSESALEELQMVITNGKLQMTDDARLAFIDKLYTEMQSYYRQVQGLNNQALSLAAQRSRAGKDNTMIKSLYGQ